MKYEEAKDLLFNSKDNLFITGGAGVGKTRLLLEYINSKVKNTAVLAPTGVAALNVGGQTIHSFFKFPINVTPHNIEIDIRIKRLCKRLETIIIDEISMVRADLLDCIDIVLRTMRNIPKTPFGGIRMIFVGDLFQLSPVISKFGDESKIFNGCPYKSPFFFDSHVFRQGFIYKIANLTQVYRQTDKFFIDFLNNIRKGIVDNCSLSEINNKCLNKKTNPFDIFLCSNNDEVEKINNKKLDQLKTESFYNEAMITGSVSTKQLPAEERLQLKIGSQIMLLNNDVEGRWVNGTIGILEDIIDSNFVRTININNQNIKITSISLYVRIPNIGLVEVEPYTWSISILELDKDEKIIRKILGSFTQFPVKVAWAFTIHKSQGKTYNNVALKLDNKPMFAPGQLYVALSRCTSLESLKLNRALKPDDILVDKRVIDFYNEHLI